MKIHVKENTLIAISFNKKKKLLDYIYDLAKWREWSPWTCMDPTVKIECSQKSEEHHHYMSWDGPIAGVGSITVNQVREDGADYDLVFIKPFKSMAKVSFNLSFHNDKETKVEWIMEGNLPFFLFFMKKFMESGVASDYRRGLKRLKFLVETGKIPAKLDFMDTPQEVSEFDFCGIETKQVPLDKLGPTMESNFKRIEAFTTALREGQNLKNNKEEFNITGGYCFYPKVNIIKMLFDYQAGHSYVGSYSKILREKGLMVKNIPPHRAIKVTLIGSYQFLDDAWAGIMMHQRALKLKPNKNIPPYEKYLVMGDDPNQYVTEIYFPVK